MRLGPQRWVVQPAQIAYSGIGMADAPMTIVETVRFLKDVKPMMSDSEREQLVAFVGANPQAGEIIPETGGVRKVRWALPGRGKRGGARVIYYYHSERLPVFLLFGICEEPEREPEQGRAERDETVGAGPDRWISEESIGGPK